MEKIVDSWQPTINLRYKYSFWFGKILQQLWVDNNGNKEWRNV